MKIKKSNFGCCVTSNGNELNIIKSGDMFVIVADNLVVEKVVTFKYALSLCIEIFQKLDSY